MMYKRGDGVKKDMEKAQHYWEVRTGTHFLSQDFFKTTSMTVTVTTMLTCEHTCGVGRMCCVRSTNN